MPNDTSRFSFRLGWFRGARKLWNCLAFHVVVDDSQRSWTTTIAIPMLFTWIVELPLIPAWLGSHILSGGVGERAEYGLWHDYHETKLQWRKIINISGPRGGWEKRWMHDHEETQISRHITILSAWVSDLAQPWVDANQVDRWHLDLTTSFAPSSSWWIPSLYDHSFVLYASQKGGVEHEATMKAKVTKRLSAAEVFSELSQQISFE